MEHGSGQRKTTAGILQVLKQQKVYESKQHVLLCELFLIFRKVVTDFTFHMLRSDI